MIDPKKDKGKAFTAIIHGEEVKGKIQVAAGKVFLCQDVHDGAPCEDTLGYDYSWYVGESDGIVKEPSLRGNEVTEFRLDVEKPKFLLFNFRPKQKQVA